MTRNHAFVSCSEIYLNENKKGKIGGKKGGCMIQSGRQNVETETWKMNGNIK